MTIAQSHNRTIAIKNSLSIAITAVLAFSSTAHSQVILQSNNCNTSTCVVKLKGAWKILAPELVGGGNYNTKSTQGNVTTFNRAGEEVTFVYGSHNNTQIAQDNTINIYAGTVSTQGKDGGVFAGRSTKGVVNNAVLIDGSDVYIKATVWGGESHQQANENKITLNNGTVTGSMKGGVSYKANAENNIVIINGGQAAAATGGHASGAGSNAYGNKVFMNGGAFTGDYSIMGGFTVYSGESKDNIVTMTGGTVSGGIYGGRNTQRGNVITNTVSVSGGTISGDIYGGKAEGQQSTSTKVVADGNTVTLAAGDIKGNVYGGLVNTAQDSYASNNTVNIVQSSTNAALTFGANTVLTGGDGGDGTLNKNNTLNMYRKNVKVSDVKGFQNYRFYLDDTVGDEDVMVYTKNGAATDISNSNFGVTVTSNNSTLTTGDAVVLIKNDNGTLTLPTTPTGGFTNQLSATQGIAKIYDFTIEGRGDNQLIAKLDKVSANPATNTLLQNGAIGNEFVNRGTDLAMLKVHGSLKGCLAKNNNVFASTSAMNYTVDSDNATITLKGGNVLIGVGKGFNNQSGKFHIAGFAEYGSAGYDANSSFANIGTINFNGNTNYYGVGMIAEQTFDNGFSVMGGTRVGKSKTSFNSSDLTTDDGKETHFDTRHNYLSAFAGANYTMNLNETSALDIYGNVKLTRFSDDTVTIHGNDFNFDAIKSTRATIGTRWSKQLTDTSTLKIGAAWEHEFDGAANGSVDNYAIKSASFKGSTGIVDVNYEFNTANNKNLRFDIGAQGTFGTRKGASVNAGLIYDF